MNTKILLISKIVKLPPVAGAMTAVALANGALFASEFDWPQWQGPARTAISQERGLLKQWPEAGLPLAWRVGDLGGGDSAPAIAQGRIFGMSHRGSDEVVWALSERDGRELWVTRLGPAHRQGMRQSQEGPGCTPTVDGDRLYVLGMGGNLACLQVQDGKIVWQRSLTEELGGRIPTWSYRESPLIDGSKLICTPGGDEAMLVALDKATGHTIWQSRMRPNGPFASRPANPSPSKIRRARSGWPIRASREIALAAGVPSRVSVCSPAVLPGPEPGRPAALAVVRVGPAVSGAAEALARLTPRSSPSTSRGSASTYNSRPEL